MVEAVNHVIKIKPRNVVYDSQMFSIFIKLKTNLRAAKRRLVLRKKISRQNVEKIHFDTDQYSLSQKPLRKTQISNYLLIKIQERPHFGGMEAELENRLLPICNPENNFLLSDAES